MFGGAQLMCSGKFRQLTALLTELKAKGSKPLIFSQWTTILDIIEWLMHDLGLPYCRLDGSTPVDERQTLVDQFNHQDSPIFAFLLTTRAGGQVPPPLPCTRLVYTAVLGAKLNGSKQVVLPLRAYTQLCWEPS
jgi:hypothetical protein